MQTDFNDFDTAGTYTIDANQTHAPQVSDNGHIMVFKNSTGINCAVYMDRDIYNCLLNKSRR